MLELDKVTIRQGDFNLSADFSIAANQTTAILGPSGSGKSTLLMAIAGFLDHAGKLLWQGNTISDLPPSKRPVSMLFQEHNLFPHLSIAENVGLGLRPDLKLSEADHAAVETALNRVGLVEKSHDLPHALSGGQRQRTALARALLRQKPIWLLDEPFAALGPGLRREMLDLVDEIRTEQGATLLLVTHAPEDAQHIAKTCVFVDENRAFAPVDAERFFASPPAGFRAYLGS